MIRNQVIGWPAVYKSKQALHCFVRTIYCYLRLMIVPYKARFKSKPCNLSQIVH